jgi:hypothetical protein
MVNKDIFAGLLHNGPEAGFVHRLNRYMAG